MNENEFLNLKNLVDSLQEEAGKFYGNGNKSAGTRLRKGMMEIKKQADVVRKEVQKLKE